jgi:hypothetical protein
MVSKEGDIDWLVRRADEYRLAKNDISEVVEDFDDIGKLRYGFSPVDELHEVDIGDGAVRRPTYVNRNLTSEQKERLCMLLKGFIGCFAWEYTEMSGLDRSLVEHRLLIKQGFRPYKQSVRNYSPKIIGQVKEEVDQLLKAGFIQPCRYAGWVSNIVPMDKKGTGKIQICVDFRNLNRATPKDEYPMPVAEMLTNSASGNKVISFLDGCQV